ncbi:hypothetical protein Fot_05212 [Forsythia ovata]|uniref:10 kDa chaperonin n=1 Tax=Forsythia ovata TaxID=205694 RepID=A0ABD1WPI4_9LAMI
MERYRLNPNLESPYRPCPKLLVEEINRRMCLPRVRYTSLKPLGDRVLVKIKTVEEKTTGGILLPTTAQSKPQGGEVVAVGEGRTIGKAKVDISLKVLASCRAFQLACVHR